MRHCPDCGFHADDTICPLCGTRMRGGVEPARTHSHNENERCLLPNQQEQPGPVMPAPRTERKSGKVDPLSVIGLIVLIVLLRSCIG